MAKFKIGDRVVECEFPDEILTVTDVSADGSVVYFDKVKKPYSKPYNSRKFKLYKEPKMKQPKTEQPPKKTPHKHAKIIKAWADGAVIEFKSKHDGEWVTTTGPNWLSSYEYRIRPEPKPDVTTYACLIGKCEHKRPEIVCSSSYNWNSGEGPSFTNSANIKFTFDGETGKLKSAKVISS